MRARLIALMVGTAVIGTAGNASAFDYDYGMVQGWEIGWNKTSETCTAQAGYEGGTDLLMTVDREGGTILVSNASWKFIKPDATYEVAFRFNGGRTWTGEVSGKRWNDGTAGFISNGSSEFMDLIARSNTIDVLVDGRFLTKLNLKGTRAALDAVVKCSGQIEHTTPPPAPPDQVAARSDSGPESAGSEEEEPSGPSSGTGIVVSRSGHVLTNYHVIKGCSTVKVTQVANLPKPAAVLRTDETNDLAILQTDQTYEAGDIARFYLGRSVRPGQTVSVYGYPLAGALSRSGNFVSGNVTSLSGLGDDVRFLQISAPVQPGNSGGPLMDESGLVIGVVSSRISDTAVAQATGSLPQNVNFAIKGTVAMDFLDVHSIPYETSTGLQPQDATEVADDAKDFTVLITCN